MNDGTYWIGVDFDGHLVEEKYPLIGKPLPIVAEMLRRRVNILEALGYEVKLILWTCRSGIQLEEAKTWCKEHGFDIYAYNENPDAKYIKSPKIPCHEYWDDRVFNPFHSIENAKLLYELNNICNDIKLGKIDIANIDERIEYLIKENISSTRRLAGGDLFSPYEIISEE